LFAQKVNRSRSRDVLGRGGEGWVRAHVNRFSVHLFVGQEGAHEA